MQNGLTVHTGANLYNKLFFAIDNYYPDPDKIRHDVLSGTGFSWFADNVSHGYPNGNSPWQGKMTRERYLPDRKLDSIVSSFVGKNVAPLLKLDHGCFRLTTETSKENMFTHQIHSDSITQEKADWAGVLYMTPVSEEIEGTVLYKNRILNKSYFSDKEDYDIIQQGMHDGSQWQKELVSYFVYNRLIVYRGDVFHSPGPAFGVDDNTGRLVQLFMWKEL